MVWYLAAFSGPAFSAYKLHATTDHRYEKSAWCEQRLCLRWACRTRSGGQKRQLQAVMGRSQRCWLCTGCAQGTVHRLEGIKAVCRQGS